MPVLYTLCMYMSTGSLCVYIPLMLDYTRTMYIMIYMIRRMNILLDEDLYKDLQCLTAQVGKHVPMAKVIRDLLSEGIEKKKSVDTSGKAVMEKLFTMNITGGDDPYLSENIDHYLYGAPKRRT